MARGWHTRGAVVGRPGQNRLVTGTEEPTTTRAEAEPVREPRASIGPGAMHHAIEKNYPKISLPLLGDVHLPPPQQLAWYGGLATLAALGILEWPVAVAVCAGHLLSQQHHVQVLRDFGRALEEA
jgi:hypothetical protein